MGIRMTANDTFRDSINAAGLTPPDVIEPGRFHRFPGEGKRNGNTAGWCKLFEDGRGGIFGDFSTGLVKSWQAKASRPVSFAEREAFRRHVEEARVAAEAERKADQETAAAEAV